MALGRRLRRVAAEQAFERLQHERELDADQHAVSGCVGLYPDGHGVGREPGLGRCPGVLGDLAGLDLHLGLQLRGKRRGEGLAQRLERR